MSEDAPEWLLEVCRRMGWDVSEWGASTLCGRCVWKREGEWADGDPAVTIRCDSGGNPVFICWVCGWYEQTVDVDHDWSAADLIEAFGAAERAINASLDDSLGEDVMAETTPTHQVLINRTEAAATRRTFTYRGDDHCEMEQHLYEAIETILALYDEIDRLKGDNDCDDEDDDEDTDNAGGA